MTFRSNYDFKPVWFHCDLYFPLFQFYDDDFKTKETITEFV